MHKYIGSCVNGFMIHDQKRENRRTFLLAECPFCHCKKWIRQDSLKHPKVVSCGCYNRESNYIKSVDLSGGKFGRLTAIKATSERSKDNGSVIWECLCSCGNSKLVSAHNLVRGGVRSCGCLQKEIQYKNGLSLGRMTIKKYCVEGTQLKNLTAKMPKSNTSGIKGVVWDNARKKWIAQIGFQGKRIHLGRYDNKNVAAKARDAAEQELFVPILEKYKNRIEKVDLTVDKSPNR